MDILYYIGTTNIQEFVIYALLFPQELLIKLIFIWCSRQGGRGDRHPESAERGVQVLPAVRVVRVGQPGEQVRV
jgi:hypothetical protein